jgi:hypothetical protein
MTKGGVLMSGKSKRDSKVGPLLGTDKKRPKAIRVDPQTTSAAEAEDPRGKFLFYMGKKIRLIKCEHLPNPRSSQTDSARTTCSTH